MVPGVPNRSDPGSQGIGKGTGLQIREQGHWARPALTRGMPAFLLGLSGLLYNSSGC